MTDKRFDVTALGEILIDFTEWGFSDAGARLFAQNPGGAVGAHSQHPRVRQQGLGDGASAGVGGLREAVR